MILDKTQGEGLVLHERTVLEFQTQSLGVVRGDPFAQYALRIVCVGECELFEREGGESECEGGARARERENVPRAERDERLLSLPPLSPLALPPSSPLPLLTCFF